MRTTKATLIRNQNLRPTIDALFDDNEDLNQFFFVHFVEFLEDKDDFYEDIRSKAKEFFESQEGEWYVLNKEKTHYNIYALSEINTCSSTKAFLNSLLKDNYDDVYTHFKPRIDAYNKMLNR